MLDKPMNHMRDVIRRIPFWLSAGVIAGTLVLASVLIASKIADAIAAIDRLAQKYEGPQADLHKEILRLQMENTAQAICLTSANKCAPNPKEGSPQ